MGMVLGRELGCSRLGIGYVDGREGLSVGVLEGWVLALCLVS